MTPARLIERPEELDRHLEAWDAMAAAAAQPQCAPGWLLAWWRHAAPPGSLLRTVVLEDPDGSLAGIAPFFANPGRAGRWDYRLLGSPLTQRREPLAAPGREAELAEACAALLLRGRPRPSLVSFEAVEADSPWAARIARAHPPPLRPRVTRRMVQEAPVVNLVQESFERWLEGRSSNFRQQYRRARRQLEEAGGRVRPSDAATLRGDVDAFLRLHHSRWEGRGGSGLPEQMGEFVLDAAAGLGLGERLRIWMIELDGEPIGAGLFVAAGGEIAYVNGGFDESQSRLRPALLAIAAAVEEGFSRGDRRIDLGSGANPYKQRFADGDDPMTWLSLRLRNRRYPITRAQLLRDDLRWWARVAANRLPPDVRERLRSRLRRN